MKILENKNALLSFAIFLNSFFLMQLSFAQTQSYGCAIQNDQKILATGTITIDNVDEFALVRYLTNGSLDSNFATNGLSAVAIGTAAQSNAIALQPNDGKSVVAGYSLVNDTAECVVLRYTTSGILDTTFGPDLNGIVQTSVGDGALASAVVLTSDDKIVIAGVTIQSGVSQFLIIQYNSDGLLDSNFGTNGIVTLLIGVRSNALSLAIQPSDGKIVIGGFSSDGLTQEAFTLARLNTDGTLDTSFGMNGVVITSFGSVSHIQSVTIQADGNIVVAGFSGTDYVIARYLTNGDLDTTFNTTGIITRTLGEQARANAVIIDSNDNIVITGYTDNALLVARYTSDGSLDTTFNGTGEATLIFGNENLGNALLLQADGKIVATGSSDGNFLLVRYLNTGLLDTSWGGNGVINNPNGVTNAGIIIVLSDQKSAGTNGGSFSAGEWVTRALNHISSNTDIVTLSSNQFTLVPGIYQILINAPAYHVDNHQIRLQDVVNNVTRALGTTAYTHSSDGSTTISQINTPLLITTPTTFEVQHICATTELNDGLGIAGGFGLPELYTTVSIVHPK